MEYGGNSHQGDAVISFDTVNRQPPVLLVAFTFNFIAISLLICFRLQVAKHVQTFKATEFKLRERNRA